MSSLKSEILRLLDPDGKLWHGGPTVTGCIRGVTAEQAAWDPGQGRHTIWGLTLHMAYWKYAVRRRIEDGPKGDFGRTPANFPDLPDERSEARWKQDRALLRAEDKALIALVRTQDESRLQESLSGHYRVADQLFGVVLHDVHHIGQIQLIKRLYQDRNL